MSPYSEHPVFQPPEDPDIKIWKYMDLPKYISLLDKQALYFARADVLAKFDPFEGQYPREFVSSFLDRAKTKQEKKHLKKILRDEDFTRMLIINCWHINDVESYHMWKIYAERNYGIAIQSTFNKLCNSFHVFKNNDVSIGKVFYNKDRIKFGNVFYRYLYKRPHYKSENELRAIILNVWKNYEKRIFDDSYLERKGEYIPIDLNILIENIYVAPQTPDWIFDLIKSISNKYSLDKPILPSLIDQKPF